MHKHRWSVAEARRRFSDLVAAAAREPQAVYRRGRLVGAVVGPEGLAALGGEGSPTLADAFDEIRVICAEEHYTLEIPRRRNRPSAFPAEDL